MKKVYGYPVDFKSKIATLVVSSDTIDSLNEWNEGVRSKEFTEKYKPNFMEYMQNPLLKGLKNYCSLFFHTCSTQQIAFINEAGVHVIPADQAKNAQDEMVLAQNLKDDPNYTVSTYLSETGNKTIAEIHGLTKDSDKWDTTTAEEKEEDFKKNAYQAQNKKDLMGEGFGQDQSGKADDQGAGLNITGVHKVGNTFQVSATKKAANPVIIKLSEEQEDQLAEMKKKLQEDIFMEKQMEMVLEQGLTQIGLSEKDRQHVLDTVYERNIDLAKIINQIQEGGFTVADFDKSLLETAVTGFGAAELAERSVKLIEDLREAGFSDENCSIIIGKVNPENFASQEDYVVACEKAVKEAILDKQQKDAAREAHAQGKAFATERRDFVNPFTNKVVANQNEIDEKVQEIISLVEMETITYGQLINLMNNSTDKLSTKAVDLITGVIPDGNWDLVDMDESIVGDVLEMLVGLSALVPDEKVEEITPDAEAEAAAIMKKMFGG